MKRSTIGFALSMAVVPNAVNAQSKPLSSFNKHKADSKSHPSHLKDSVRDTHQDISQLIKLVLNEGRASKFPASVATHVGTTATLPVPARDVRVQKHICTLLLPTSDSHPGNDSQPDCVYLRTHIQTSRDLDSKFFRVSLDGRLEKVYVLHGVYDTAGKPASATSSYPDVNSPEIQKEFRAEMNFWLKEWLPKQKEVAAAPETMKSPGKVWPAKTAASATSAKKAAPVAAPAKAAVKTPAAKP
jgi:hypothetical protein